MWLKFPALCWLICWLRLNQALFEARSTSSHLHRPQPTGRRRFPPYLPRIPLWSSPSTGPTTWRWCRTRLSRGCPATISPCSCGCVGGAPTSSRLLLSRKRVARKRRPLCAALSRMVSYDQLHHLNYSTLQWHSNNPNLDQYHAFISNIL